MWKYYFYSPIWDIIFNVILVPLTATKSISWCMVETSLDLRRKYWTIVGNLSQIFGNCREMFWNVLLSSGLRPKRRYVYCLKLPGRLEMRNLSSHVENTRREISYLPAALERVSYENIRTWLWGFPLWGAFIRPSL